MKKALIQFFVVSIIVASAYAGAHLEYFHTRQSGENVLLEWRTLEETNLKHYLVERKTPQSSYIEIAAVQPKGSNSFYSYEDETAYKANDLFFTYRLKIVDNNEQVSYSNESSVTSRPSDIKRTWGSIKAMFR